MRHFLKLFGGNMKKIIGFVFFVFIAGICFGQTEEAVNLNQAIKEANEYLIGRLKPGIKLVVLNFNVPTKELSDYIIEELSVEIVNNSSLTVVDRRNLELIQQEINFQLTGEVSDETAQAIGQKLGAQTVISGSMSKLGDIYRFRLHALEVETAAVQGMYSTNIKEDNILAALLQKKIRVVPPSISGTGFFIGLKAGTVIGIASSEPEKKIFPDYLNLLESVSWETKNGNIGFIGAVYAGYMFTPFFGFETGVHIITNNGMELVGKDPFWGETYTENFSYTSLDIPLLLRLRFAVGTSNTITLGLNVGAYLSLPVSDLDYSFKGYFNGDKGDIKESLNYGILAGINTGFKIGNGNIVLDIHYLMDFLPTTATYNIKGSTNGWDLDWVQNDTLFTRQGIKILLGYEYMF
jgi:TolB-like protein